MLLLSQINNNKDTIIKGLELRNFQDPEKIINRVIALDKQRKNTQSELDSTLNELNVLSRSIGNLFKEGKKEEAEKAKGVTKVLKDKSKSLSERLSEVQLQLETLLYTIPNIPHQDVPAGRTSEENQIIFEWGEKPKLSDAALPHWELIEKYDIIDFSRSKRTSGTRSGLDLSRCSIRCVLYSQSYR